MSSDSTCLNGTRLSLAIANLPLTPFGMRSPYSNKSEENNFENGLSLNKLSRQFNCSPKNTKISSLEAPIISNRNLCNVNSTRRKIKKSINSHKVISTAVKSCLNNLDSKENCCKNLSFVETTPKIPEEFITEIPAGNDSYFSDIDDGNFVEFPENNPDPVSNNALDKKDQPFYTCLGLSRNETIFSTSSKFPKAEVGFHQFVDHLGDPTYPLDVSKQSKLSKDKFNCLRHHEKVKDLNINDTVVHNFIVMNSTMNPNGICAPADFPDISSLSLNCCASPPKTEVKSTSFEISKKCDGVSRDTCFKLKKNNQKEFDFDCLENIIQAKETVFPENCHSSNPHVIEWVMKSPFKDASYGTSFLVSKNKLNNSSQDQLQLYLDPSDSCNESTYNNLGDSIITIGKVAESPREKAINQLDHYEKHQPLLPFSLLKNLNSNDSEPTANDRSSSGSQTLKFNKIHGTTLGNNSIDNIQKKGSDSTTLIHSNNEEKESIIYSDEESIIYSDEDDKILTNMLSRRISLSTPNLDRHRFDEHLILQTSNKDRQVSVLPETIPYSSNLKSKQIFKSNSVSKLNGDHKISPSIKAGIRPNMPSPTAIKDNFSPKPILVLSSSESDDNSHLITHNKSGKDLANFKSTVIVISDSSSSSEMSPKIYNGHDKRKYSTLNQFSKDILLSNEPNLDKNRLSERHKAIPIPAFDLSSESDADVEKKSNQYTENFNKIQVSNEKNSKLSSTETSESSSEDNFNRYINEWKNKKLETTLKKKKKTEQRTFVVEDSDCESINNDDYIKTPYFNRNLPNVSRWNQPFSDSSDDSDDYQAKFKSNNKKIPKFKLLQTPNTASTMLNPGLSSSTNSSKPTYISFLSSLSLVEPFKNAHQEALPFLKYFKKQKEILTKKLYIYFNNHIFDNKLPAEMKITWNVRLTTTAGRCHLQMDKSQPLGRGARIELSMKVIDGPARLRDTLIHELCHAATWIISGYKGGHGKIWKAWASKSVHMFPELPSISRCHSYDIQCKYTYRCINCGYSYGRHSKSIDMEKKVCGICKGRFELIVNKMNKKTHLKSSLGEPAPPRTPNAFALFVKENYSTIKKSKNDLKHRDVMKELSENFAKLKANNL